MKSLISDDKFKIYLKRIGTLVILSINYFYVLHYHGVVPCKSSYIIIPIDQISFFRE